MSKKLSAEEREELALRENIRQIMKQKAGQEFVWAILEECHIGSSSFTGNSQTFYLEGERAVGLRIIEMLESADPTIYPRMLLENAKKIKSEEGEDNA